MDERGRKGVWRFVGIAELLPIYDEIEDGCEIIDTPYCCAVKTVERQVAGKKEDLQIFK